MKHNRLIQLIFQYLKEKHKQIFFYLLWHGVFGLVLFLSNVTTITIYYGSGLVTSIALIYSGVECYYFIKKVIQWERLLLCQDITKSMLPEAKTFQERYYIQLFHQMIDERQVRIASWDQKTTDLMDYYTLWTHQIKTPIAAMHLIHQEWMEQMAIDHPMSKSINNARQELFKIQQYVESVIQFTKLESAPSDFRFEMYALDELIRQAVKKYALLFIHQKLSLNYTTVEETVLTDEKWLVFVIEQLLSNALKYTPSGAISIYWEAKSQSLIIEDTGIGIQPEDLPRVFEKGFTGFNGRMDKKSTGIGLYLCQQIIKKLGHTLSIQSTIGQGTQVIIGLERK